MRRVPEETMTVKVNVGVDHGEIVFDKCCLHVLPGDTIEWKFDGKRAFAIIVKDFVSPLEWDTKVVNKGVKSAQSTVVTDADYGLYPYTICAVDGDRLLVADPEIIVHPPGGRR